MTPTITLFSGGIGSWAAAMRVAKIREPDQQTLLFTDTRTEDPDLYRFLAEAATVVGSELVTIADGRNVWEVFNDEHMIGNTRADLCSRILKRDLARKWIDDRYPDGTDVVMGVDWSEIHRFERAAPRWLPHRLSAPMCDPPYLSKPEMLAWAKDLGLRPPALYEWASHNNCGGFCVKAGLGQFAALLRNNPDRYAWHETQEEAFRAEHGDVAIMRDRRGGQTRPLPMRELRERLEQGMTDQLPLDDFGGCGCMVDDV